MPRTSRTSRAVGGERALWGDQEHLLATLVDVAAQHAWMFGEINSKGRSTPPVPLRRPGQEDPNKRLGGQKSYPFVEIDRILARARARGGD